MTAQIMGGAAEAKNSLSKMATDVSTWQVCHLPHVYSVLLEPP